MIKINENLFVPAAPFGFSPRFPTGKKGYIQKRGHYIKNWKMRQVKYVKSKNGLLVIEIFELIFIDFGRI